jgi:hypothetical protein
MVGPSHSLVTMRVSWRACMMLAIMIAGCDGDDFFSGRGQVTRCGSQTPIAGVCIRLSSGNSYEERYSDAHGVFPTNIGARADATVALVADKPGYKRFETTLNGERLAPVMICLKPEGASAGE